MSVDVVSVFMSNLPYAVATAQDAVVQRLLPSGARWHQVHSAAGHGEALDAFLRASDAEVFVVLDADAIPISQRAISFLIERAMAGVLIGNAQRSNHIENGRHVYAAPSAMAFSRDTFARLGAPSFVPTSRGDVAEELTYAAEERGIAVEILDPVEVLGEKCWALAGDDTPRYGNACIFGRQADGLFYHQFQIRLAEQQRPFLAACDAVVRGERLSREVVFGAQPVPKPPTVHMVDRSFFDAFARALASGEREALIMPPSAQRLDSAEDDARWARFFMRAPSLFGIARLCTDGLLARARRRLLQRPVFHPMADARDSVTPFLIERRAMQRAMNHLPSAALHTADAGMFLEAARGVVTVAHGFCGPIDCHWLLL